MIKWFEWDKCEVQVHARVDWTATSAPTVRAPLITRLLRAARTTVVGRASRHALAPKPTALELVGAQLRPV